MARAHDLEDSGGGGPRLGLWGGEETLDNHGGEGGEETLNSSHFFRPQVQFFQTFKFTSNFGKNARWAKHLPRSALEALLPSWTPRCRTKPSGGAGVAAAAALSNAQTDTI